MGKGKIILVNASAAKLGGAETIVRTFVQNVPKDENKYILLSPLSFEVDQRNIQVIYKKTSGFLSVFFSTIGIIWYILKIKPDRILSFSNINCIFFTERGITYFHQPMALKDDYSGMVVKVYNFIIPRFLKRNTFIVQSSYIRQLFLDRFKFPARQVISCWPGFTIPREKGKTSIVKDNYHYTGFLPIAYDYPHKNLRFLHSLESFFFRQNIQILTLGAKDFPLKNERVFSNRGSASREEMFSFYEQVDFLIFPSKDETVGLPVFEFLRTGKPAFVFAAPYALEFYEQFGRPFNFILFSSAEEFIEKFEASIHRKFTSADFSRGEWNKIFSLF